MKRLLINAAISASLSGCTLNFWTSGVKRERALENYGADVASEADAQGLPYAYFMALTALECSGNRPCGTRLEPTRYEDLDAVRSGRKKRFENIRTADVHDATDPALENLATSWGPFQIMGYKCIGLGVNVADIRGDRAIHHGMRWVAKDYGHLLEAGRFKDAFHVHNAGTLHPKKGPARTHDPRYVQKGLDYMEWFEANRPD